MPILKRVVVVLGAGATRGDSASSVTEWRRPILDRGFFSQTVRAHRPPRDYSAKVGAKSLYKIREYMEQTYGHRITDAQYDRLESVFVAVYTDMFNSLLANSAQTAFRELVRLLTRRTADTTNPLTPNPLSPLYRLFIRLFDAGFVPGNITLITFNYDLHIERTLLRLSQTSKWASRWPHLFSFPQCYHLSTAISWTKPKAGTHDLFPVTTNAKRGFRVLKLHGSLNWYSEYRTPMPTRDFLLDPDRKFEVTRRTHIDSSMTRRHGKNSVKTFPLVVPPVTHKAGIMHHELPAIWERAEDDLENCTELVVYGYSCPPTDVEASNMFLRAVRHSRIQRMTVIDPSPASFQRFVELTDSRRADLPTMYYRSIDAFLGDANW